MAPTSSSSPTAGDVNSSCVAATSVLTLPVAPSADAVMVSGPDTVPVTMNFARPAASVVTVLALSALPADDVTWTCLPPITSPAASRSATLNSVGELAISVAGPSSETVVPTTPIEIALEIEPERALTLTSRLVGSTTVSVAVTDPVASVTVPPCSSTTPESAVEKETTWFAIARLPLSLTNAVTVATALPSEPTDGTLVVSASDEASVVAPDVPPCAPAPLPPPQPATSSAVAKAAPAAINHFQTRHRHFPFSLVRFVAGRAVPGMPPGPRQRASAVSVTTRGVRNTSNSVRSLRGRRLLERRSRSSEGRRAAAPC